MKVTQLICLLQVVSLGWASTKYPEEEYDLVQPASNIDTKSLDIDIQPDTDVAKYSEKKHPKGRAGSVTEIKPAKVASDEGLLEDAPTYLKEADKKKEDSTKVVADETALDVEPIKSKAEKKLESEEENKPDEFHSFIMSVSMICVSEIGDKTFLIAALMAMRSPKLVVFSAAASALVVMTILSGIVGHALPALIPQRLTQFLASALFVVFGYKLFREAKEMSNEVGVSDEMAEVEEEIALSSINEKNGDLETGSGGYTKAKSSGFQEYLSQFKQLLGFVLSPTWVQVFVLTFLGEWGDRSQIATIALAAGSDYWFVILGGCVGHTMCTGVAVLGGMFLASRISMKQVTLGGAVTFLLFAVLYFYEAMWGEH
ncbi:putative ribosome biosynthesis protein [Saccharomycopsis crataegensis]|uniref:GDT1 family protein n=1 Tax=Saccharomycopsis crataegensis TaxID=43959 RepID=A0AAV5QR59_9ASCO|nr:putative ribosome biosynthesis protein [Saccharomycopsis crataegensis]